jgi:DUF1680 family protein
MLEPRTPATTTSVKDPDPAVPQPGREGPVSPSVAARQILRPLSGGALTLEPDGLLGGWQLRNATRTMPHCVDQLYAGGALGNMRRPIGDAGPHVGIWFSDSDAYKTLEAIAWHLASVEDPALSEAFEAIVDVIAEAQDHDGYLNSYFQHDDPQRRWSELSTSHELYCAGHLIQAAVAASRSGLGTRLMPIARRFADLIVREFGPEGREAVCGHPEIETALVELFRETGHQPYLRLAHRFVGLRGHGLLGEGQFGAAYFQDHVPVVSADEFTGHAVRQLYLLAGVVDVAVETGDETLLAAAERLWDSAFASKTYVTGGHGSRHRDEAIGDPFELPPDRAYAETCAAIGSFQWNWRMLLATGGHRYADEMERVLYNAVAVATALDGRHFFYSNPLHLRTGHDHGGEDAPSQRLPWYTCACCPPNLARLMASLHHYLATSDEDGLRIHQYTAGTIDTGPHRVRMSTDYPWSGEITLDVRSDDDRPWTLALRIPGWCTDYTLTVDGVVQGSTPVDGYLRVRRVWDRQRVVLQLSMPARLIAPHPRIDSVRGCVALARGPLLYCVEQADLPAGIVLEDVRLDPKRPVQVRDDRTGTPFRVTLSGRGHALDRSAVPLYHLYQADGETESAPRITVPAVPYFLWGNRRPGPMRVWVPTVATTHAPADRHDP